MAGGAERRLVSGPFFFFGKILPGGRQRSGAEAAFAAEAYAICGRRITCRQRADRRKVRRVSDAWRSTGTRGGENRRPARTSRAPQLTAAEIWCSRLRDRPRDRARSTGR